MLSALCWVPKGFAKSMPDRFKDPELEGEENAEEDANIDDENEYVNSQYFSVLIHINNFSIANLDQALLLRLISR
jgi:hypothetical protein